MPLSPKNARSWFGQHWFFPVAIFVVVGDFCAAKLGEWSSDVSLLEAALIFDFAVLLPLLYWWCYRERRKVAVLKAIALACLGIWAIGWLIPEDQRNLLEPLGVFRYAALGALIALEVWLGVAVYRAVITAELSRDDAETKLKSDGLPAWIAKFMAFEASLLRRVWLFVDRIVRRKKR
jgi:hypothetical protein